MYSAAGLYDAPENLLSTAITRTQNVVQKEAGTIRVKITALENRTTERLRAQKKTQKVSKKPGNCKINITPN